MLNDKTLELFSQLSERELIYRVAQQDPNAVEFFFLHKYRDIFDRHAANIFKNQIETSELINEFYIYLQKDNWSKLNSFEGKSKLSTWLTVVASRFFIKKKEGMTFLNEKIALHIDDFIGTLVVDSSKTFTQFEVYDAVNKIQNPKYRYTLLAELQGFDTNEIAQKLGTSVGNIYNYRKRGKIALVELLNERKNG
ncbi:MAG: hypothetical protein MJZ87_07640 [Bacteroidales bacterium]|nr:hypothetical protein [Bacteroidales bacterium]